MSTFNNSSTVDSVEVSSSNVSSSNVSSNSNHLQHEESKEVLQARKLSEQMIALGEKFGAFKPYDSQLTIPEVVGTRIVKCLYQVTKHGANKGKKPAENSYSRIPTKHLTEELICSRVAELSPYILGWLQGLEDAAIKEYHKAGGTQVYIPKLGLDDIIAKLEESEAGSRLNKDKIEAWFVDSLQDALATRFAVKLGLDENSSEEDLIKLEQVLNAYKAKFASLASGKTFIKESDCKAMIAVVVSCEADKDLLGARFISRLEKMSQKEDDLLLSL